MPIPAPTRTVRPRSRHATLIGGMRHTALRRRASIGEHLRRCSLQVDWVLSVNARGGRRIRGVRVRRREHRRHVKRTATHALIWGTGTTANDVSFGGVISTCEVTEHEVVPTGTSPYPRLK